MLRGIVKLQNFRAGKAIAFLPAFFFLFAAASGLAAQSPHGLEPKAAFSPDFYFDADPRLGISDIASPGYDRRFIPSDNSPLWVGREAPVAWLRFPVPEADPLNGPGILEVKTSFSIILDRVEVYVPLKSGGFRHYQDGALEAHPVGSLRNRYFVFPLPLDIQPGRYCYLRLEGRIDVQFWLQLLGQSEFSRQNFAESLPYGIVFGILLAMVLYNFFLCLSLRDPSYFFYLCYVFFGLAWLFFVQGWARLTFGSHPGIDQSLLWLFAGMMLASGTIFTICFLKLRASLPSLYAILLAFTGLALCAAITGVLGWHRTAMLLTNWLTAVLCVSVVVAAILRLVSGFGSALYFLIAWSVLTISGLVFFLMDMKVLPVSFLTSNSMALGQSLESILLSMALADRVRRLEKEKKELQRNEARLKEANEKDALTGLLKKNILIQNLEKAMAVAKAEGGQLVLLMIDIDNFKDFNDNWGHKLGDQVLASLGKLLGASVRASDLAGRYGGEEFVLALPRASIEEAALIAERIRQSFASELFTLDGGSGISLTLSIGISELREGDTLKGFLERTDDTMYEAKHLGKNRVVVKGKQKADAFLSGKHPL